MDNELKILLDDMKRSLKEQHPELVLDRLHTYVAKIIRQICEKNEVLIKNEKGELYPLHSLIGMLLKKYKADGKINEFSEVAIKQSISVFEKFNDIRNNNSYAHDNEILQKDDAFYVINTIFNLLNYLYYIETGTSQYVNANVVNPTDVYKYICLHDIVTTKKIAENFNISIDDAKKILMELLKVNGAIKTAHLMCDPEDDNCQWEKA